MAFGSIAILAGLNVPAQYRNGGSGKKEKINSSRNGLEIIKDSIAFHSRLVSLDLSSLNAVEKLELERWI